MGLRLQHPAELHRRGALAPLLRIMQRPSKGVTSSAGRGDRRDVNGYGQYRSPIALSCPLLLPAASWSILGRFSQRQLFRPRRWRVTASLAQALARPRGSHRPEHATARTANPTVIRVTLHGEIPHRWMAQLDHRTYPYMSGIYLLVPFSFLILIGCLVTLKS